MRALQLIKTTRGATWALRQVRVLRSLGVDVDVVLPDNEGIAGAYREAGAGVHILQTDLASLKSPSAFLKAQRAFRGLVADVEPDVIHSHFVGTTLFMRLALGQSGPARIFQVPGPLHLENPVTRWGELTSAGARDHWIASCRYTRDVYLAAGVGENRVGLSYYGLNLSQFRNAEVVPLRYELGLDPDTAIIGMVSYIYAPKRWLGQKRGLKGHEDLIDAVRMLVNAGRDCVVVFVGGAWAGADSYEARVRAYARSALGDRARFLGNRSDVSGLYPCFDVAVHPSHSENLGGAVESLAAKTPTIATNVGGFPDVVLPGITGWLVPARDSEALARAIAEALDDPIRARRYAASGSDLVDDLLDVERNGIEIRDLYKSFAGAWAAKHDQGTPPD